MALSGVGWRCGWLAGWLHAACAAAALQPPAPNPAWPAALSVQQQPPPPTPCCSPKISPDVSAKVVAALHDIGMLTPQGYVKVDPRKVSRAWPWVTQLLEKVPELRGGMDADHSVVSCAGRARGRGELQGGGNCCRPATRLTVSAGQCRCKGWSSSPGACQAGSRGPPVSACADLAYLPLLSFHPLPPSIHLCCRYGRSSIWHIPRTKSSPTLPRWPWPGLRAGKWLCLCGGGGARAWGWGRGPELGSVCAFVGLGLHTPRWLGRGPRYSSACPSPLWAHRCLTLPSLPAALPACCPPLHHPSCPCRAKEADFERIFQRYAVPGAGIVGDPAGALPPGWVPPPDDDVRHGAKKGKAKKQQQHKAPTEDAYPYEAHEAVVEAALEAVSASGKEGGDDEAAAAADAAGAAAADAHVAALEAASVEETPRAEDKAVAAAAEQEEEGAVATTGAAVVMPAEARDQQAQHRKTYIQRSSSSSGNEEQPQGPSVTEASGRVAFATLAAGPVATTAATAVPATTASPAVSAPAKDIDSSAAKHRPAVSATAAVIGGACLTVAAVAMGLVLIRIRQRRAQGFAALPTREPALRPHGRLAPIPESPRIAGADHNDHAV